MCLRLSLKRHLRMARRQWQYVLMLGGLSVLVYYVVYHAEDDVRNIFLSIRVSTSLMFVAAPRDTAPVNCAALLQGDQTEIIKARSSNEKPAVGGVPEIGQSCNEFKKTRNYILDVSQAEQDFPIAFSIMVYKNSQQVERLLRAVYRPSNVYCIHVDRKSTVMLLEMQRLVSCFDNVFLSSRQIDVRWGQFSVLEAELVCMSDLLTYSQKWKYFINLTGQEYPLKTNNELVKILTTYDGANDVSGTVTRYNENIRRFWGAGSAPHGITPAIGSVHIVVNRHFVNFSVNDPIAKDLQQWLRFTKIPDETYFPTLNFNPQLNIPGTFKGKPRLEPFLTRFKNWDHGLLVFMDDCKGKYMREICVLGVGDLPNLVTQKHLFVNKLEDTFQPAALNCLEEWYFNKTQAEQHGAIKFDTSYYSKLDFVLNKVEAR